jgi:hypothetical protein
MAILGIGLSEQGSSTRFSADIVSRRCHLNKEKQMKLRYVAPLAIAASAAAIGLAPIATADATVQQSPGNAQITATPGAAAQQAAQQQQPFGGDMGALLFHH